MRPQVQVCLALSFVLAACGGSPKVTYPPQLRLPGNGQVFEIHTGQQGQVWVAATTGLYELSGGALAAHPVCVPYVEQLPDR